MDSLHPILGLIVLQKLTKNILQIASLTELTRVEVEHKHRVLVPRPGHRLYVKAGEQFAPALPEITQSGEEQRLAEPARASQETILGALDQSAYVHGLVHIDIAVEPQVIEVLLPDRIPNNPCRVHICQSWSEQNYK